MIKTRQATILDVEALSKLGQDVSEFSVSDETIGFWPQEILQNIVVSNDAILLVAEDASELKGFIIANCNKAFKKVIIENIYVSPIARNLGVGKQLLSELLTLIEKDGYEYVSTLIPLEAHEASKLYIDFGFAKGEIFQWLDRSLSNNFNQTSSHFIQYAVPNSN